MAEEHGYPDWQRLSQQQTEPLYSETFVSPPKSGSIVLGTFYVGLYPAISVLVAQLAGTAGGELLFQWHSQEPITTPFQTDDYWLASENALFEQQLVCKGPWVTITLFNLSSEGVSSYNVLIQPNALIYSDPRLGENLLLRSLKTLKASETQNVALRRLAPGRGFIRFRCNTEAPSVAVALESRTGAAFTTIGIWKLSAFTKDQIVGGNLSIPINFPRGALRVQIENEAKVEYLIEVGVFF